MALVLFVWTRAWRFGFFRQPEEIGRLAPSLGEVGSVFFTYLFVQLLVASALVQVLYELAGVPAKETFTQPGALLWVLVAGGFLGLSFVLPFTRRPQAYSPQIWQWGPQTRWAPLRHFSLGVVTWLVAFPFVAIINFGAETWITWLTNQGPQEQVAVRMVKNQGASLLQMILVLSSVAVLIPIVEEILFRGFFQGYLRRYLGVWSSIALSSLCFSMFHFSWSQSWSNVVILLSLSILGLFLGYLYERQRSLWAPIGLHVAFNTISLTYIFLYDR